MASPRVSPFKPEQVWQHAREPMFWLDSALRVTWVNQAWELAVGVSAGAIVGQHVVSSGDPPAGGVIPFLLPPLEALAGNPSGSLMPVPLGSGGTEWRRVEFWPFCDAAGTLLGLLGQLREPAASPSVPDAPTRQIPELLLRLREQSRSAFGIDSLIGSGPAHRRLLEQVRLAAASTMPVLVIGEPGTGRRQVAGAIHQLGAGREQALIPIDCEALAPEILERELFRAAGETDRQSSEPGMSPPLTPTRLNFAPGATVLLQEVLALPRDLQGRLVDALDGRVRLIASTAGDPDAALRSDHLRPDLYHALTVLVLRLEPLRRRRPDLPVLAQHLLERANERWGFHCAGLTTAAHEVIAAYDWPGNLRELARVIDTAHAQARGRHSARERNGGTMIGAEDLPATIRGSLGAAYLPPAAVAPIKPLDELLTEIERRLIETALAKARQNKSRAAELLGISRPRLYRRIKELNLPEDSEEEAEAAPAGIPEPGGA